MGVIIFLFLSGVLFICDGLHVLGPFGPLIVELGGSVMLPCYVEAPIPLEELEVEWKRTDSETVVHLFQDGESRPEAQDQAYSGRARFFTEEVERGNFSLLLTNLTSKDAGVYNCSVYRQQETGHTSVEIKEIERLIVTGGHVVSAYASEDITMNCSVDSSVPPEKLEVLWKTVDQQIPVLFFEKGEVRTESTHERYTDRVEFFSPEERQKGNFSLRLKDLRTEDKGHYICEVSSGDFSANTTVEVLQLGFSSMHTGTLLLCVLAFVVPVFLSYSASTSLTKNDDSRRALAVQYTLVCCPNIAMCLAFILWGVIEGFYREAATCSALNLMRILSLFWIAPYLDTFKENLQRFIKRTAITLEYAVITAFSYPGLIVRLWDIYQKDNDYRVLLTIIFLMLLLLALCIRTFIQGLTSIIKNEGLINYHLTEVINYGRGVVIVVIYNFITTNVVLAWLPILTVCFSFCRCQGLFNRGSKVLIWMSVLLILEVISASSSVYIQNVSLQTHKERGGLTCVAAYLHILTGMLFFNALFYVYDKSHAEQTRRSVEIDSTVTEPQRTSGHAIVYMLGAVGLSFVNSVALAVELILKARNGERTVEDLRVILIPSECIFAICCLMLQISAFWRTNRENLMDDLRDLCQLFGCKQASVDSPVHNHELQAIPSTEAAPAP
ncbi:uncharacterized protein LOC118808885 [Colossoma macropomum]|uniref:uncharacterized protein LOC118808885 n=1 Tax=Colossoma macropomum TaxID=42526 RepID=UPI001863CA31|nr:uncharacterized protein LOC118808885 [Colossoma macropomum]